MKNKKGISELVAYVHLISLSIALSIVVYNWLRAYVLPYQPKACPDGMSIIIKDYNCYTGNITLNLSNKGLFRIDGYIFRINNESDATGNPVGLPINVIITKTLTTPLQPGEVTSGSWNYKNKYGKIVEMEIEPFRLDGDKNVLCDKATIKQRTLLECN